MKDGRLVKDGAPLAFELLAQTRQQERLMLSYARTLERLGIGVRIRQVDTRAVLGAAQDLRLRHDPMDLERVAVARQRADQPLEQQGRRHRGLAQLPRRQEPGRRRHDRGPAAGAQAAEDFTAAVRAFDRVLISGDYVIPLFHLPKVWVAHWSHLRYPGGRPLAATTSTPGGPAPPDPALSSPAPFHYTARSPCTSTADLPPLEASRSAPWCVDWTASR